MKIAATGQFLLVLMACSVIQIVCQSLHGNETDRLSLLDFKNAIILDPQQALVSWNDSTQVCSWEGVFCRVKAPNHVVALNLTNRDLVGTISPSLGNLTFLKHLILTGNAFTGQIPASLAHLHRLQTLSLAANTLQGRIPNLANYSDLMVLDLFRNNLAGKFPADLPHRLEKLRLSFNNITGTIPASLANITTLKYFACVNTSIEGNIPDEFSKLSALEILYLDINKLTGSFPEAVLNISALTGLSFAINDLHGEVPPDLGPIPDSLSNLKYLGQLDLSFNHLNGEVPTKGIFKNATAVQIDGNQGLCECSDGGQVSTASDVYSFGVVLLEIFIRRRPTDDMFMDGLSIAKYTAINFPDKILEIVDPKLHQELIPCSTEKEELDPCQETPIAVEEKGLHVTLYGKHWICCTKPTPGERISMQEVAAKLHRIKDAYLREY
ncbi:hypothetical protein OsI_35513 [Oryza sativa Indica Group]|uniref:non-specific serine/threonine protein kinase n=1 Tax=Oryza sativa subsp. indica TaxID=39946 RepID=A2ZCK9_ORYSI|nr:hypothetical protein OsI_35513 [Oryza sativa Indica Group]